MCIIAMRDFLGWEIERCDCLVCGDQMLANITFDSIYRIIIIIWWVYCKTMHILYRAGCTNWKFFIASTYIADVETEEGVSALI